MQILTYFSLVFTMMLWGGTFIAGRLLAGNVEPASAAFLRFFIASIGMIILVLVSEKRLPPPPRKLWLPLILLGVTGVFLYNIFFFTGLHSVSAGRASMIIACTPLVITFFAATFLGERLQHVSHDQCLLFCNYRHYPSRLSSSTGRFVQSPWFPVHT